MANTLQQRIERSLAEIETLRDSLKVQLHLAKAEMRDEWDELEERWESIHTGLENLKQQTEQEASDLQEKINIVAEELAAAYRRIHRRLSDEEE